MLPGKRAGSSDREARLGPGAVSHQQRRVSVHRCSECGGAHPITLMACWAEMCAWSQSSYRAVQMVRYFLAGSDSTQANFLYSGWPCSDTNTDANKCPDVCFPVAEDIPFPHPSSSASSYRYLISCDDFCLASSLPIAAHTRVLLLLGGTAQAEGRRLELAATRRQYYCLKSWETRIHRREIKTLLNCEG